MKEYIYQVNHSTFELDLCKMETRALFNTDLKDKMIKSHKFINPAVSPYIRYRLEVLYSADHFEALVERVKEADINTPDYIVKYLGLEQDTRTSDQKRDICKALGLVMDGPVCFKNPKISYGVIEYENIWYFGLLEEADQSWRVHKSRPHTYSSSISLNVAKVLLNLATKGDQSKRIIDPCCGVGTVLIEACYAGYKIKGVEINDKIAIGARNNLEYFNYYTPVEIGDIKDINESFDVAIVDLPYGNFSKATKEDQYMIIQEAKRISDKLVLVASEDLSNALNDFEYEIVDHCILYKRSNNKFARHIWICK